MRPTRAEINLDNLAANFRAMQTLVGTEVKVMAVVKADAYGHGAVKCARRLAKEGAEWFGVALPEEALELREQGIEQPILTLGGFWENQEELCVKEKITPVVFRLDLAERLNQAAKNLNQIADVHIKIDTGMGRLGVRFDAVGEFAEALTHLQNLRIDGLMTHFAAADEAHNDEFTALQIKRFEDAATVFREKGFRPTWCDLANSPATLAHPGSWKNLVRVGGALYGIGKDIFPPGKTVENLLPVMSLKSKITLLKTVPRGETLGYSRSFTTERDSLIASVPIGYNDGFPRGLSNKGKAIVNGTFAPVVGRVSMDVILLDVTDVPNARLNDDVCLIGEQDGLRISVEDVAEICGTISYEITCGISRRVPRVFQSKAEI